jgi:hypothetical protein
MKRCPFCAEEIQDAAIVCKHCGRDLPAATTPEASEPVNQPAKKSNRALWTGLLIFGVLAVLWIGAVSRPRVPDYTSRTRAAAEPPEPDEPCTVEAPASARQAAQNWCEGGVFTKVNVSTKANNFIVLLQFSKKGQRSWQLGKTEILNRFRRVTDEMVAKTDMNVAFSLHGTDGQMLGGCVRKNSASESTCNGR